MAYELEMTNRRGSSPHQVGTDIVERNLSQRSGVGQNDGPSSGGIVRNGIWYSNTEYDRLYGRRDAAAADAQEGAGSPAPAAASARTAAPKLSAAAAPAPYTAGDPKQIAATKAGVADTVQGMKVAQAAHEQKAKDLNSADIEIARGFGSLYGALAQGAGYKWTAPSGGKQFTRADLNPVQVQNLGDSLARLGYLGQGDRILQVSGREDDDGNISFGMSIRRANGKTERVYRSLDDAYWMMHNAKAAQRDPDKPMAYDTETVSVFGDRFNHRRDSPEERANQYKNRQLEMEVEKLGLEKSRLGLEKARLLTNALPKDAFHTLAQKKMDFVRNALSDPRNLETQVESVFYWDGESELPKGAIPLDEFDDQGRRKYSITTTERMEPDEAVRYWGNVFDNAAEEAAGAPDDGTSPIQVLAGILNDAVSPEAREQAAAGNAAPETREQAAPAEQGQGEKPGAEKPVEAGRDTYGVPVESGKEPITYEQWRSAFADWKKTFMDDMGQSEGEASANAVAMLRSTYGGLWLSGRFYPDRPPAKASTQEAGNGKRWEVPSPTAAADAGSSEGTGQTPELAS